MLGIGTPRSQLVPAYWLFPRGVPRTVPDARGVPASGAALRKFEATGSVQPSAIVALRLLMLTGCRMREILTLRWDDVDRTAGVLRLRGETRTTHSAVDRFGADGARRHRTDRERSLVFSQQIWWSSDKSFLAVFRWQARAPWFRCQGRDSFTIPQDVWVRDGKLWVP